MELLRQNGSVRDLPGLYLTGGVTSKMKASARNAQLRGWVFGDVFRDVLDGV